MKSLILISGPQGSGKSTKAQMLAPYTEEVEVTKDTNIKELLNVHTPRHTIVLTYQNPKSMVPRKITAEIGDYCERCKVKLTLIKIFPNV